MNPRLRTRICLHLQRCARKSALNVQTVRLRVDFLARLVSTDISALASCFALPPPYMDPLRLRHCRLFSGVHQIRGSPQSGSKHPCDWNPSMPTVLWALGSLRWYGYPFTCQTCDFEIVSTPLVRSRLVPDPRRGSPGSQTSVRCQSLLVCDKTASGRGRAYTQYPASAYADAFMIILENNLAGQV